MRRKLFDKDGRQPARARRIWRNLRCLGVVLTCGLGCGGLFEARAAGIPEPDLVWYGRVMQSGVGPSARLTSGTLEWVLQPANGGTARVVSVALTNLNDQFSYVLRIPCETVPAGFDASGNRLPLVDPPVTYDRTGVTWNGVALELEAGPGAFTLSANQRGRVERLDLLLTTPALDSDGDGLPDWWENQYFGGAGTQPESDSDGDGLTDGQEYLAGTSPSDAASVLAVSIVPTENGIEVQWLSAAAKTYRVLRSTELSDDPAVFAILQSGLAATPPLNVYLDDEEIASLAFYLVQVEE